MQNDIREEVAKKSTEELVMEFKSLHIGITTQLLLNYFDGNFERDRQRYIAIYEELQSRLQGKQTTKETF